ncbi:MAG: nitrile hydratase accessory protein [Pseudomonadota bacterium]|nr:nitrile hydratase accessory protein [Pseudomonadota bacterium]
MVELPRIEGMPAIPMDEGGPVFNEPWEAQAFALVLTLYQGRHFTWPEWVDALSVEIADAAAQGEPDLGRTYYHYWLAALEKLVVAKELGRLVELQARKAALEANPPDRHGHAARRSPVGVGRADPDLA